MERECVACSRDQSIKVELMFAVHVLYFALRSPNLAAIMLHLLKGVQTMKKTTSNAKRLLIVILAVAVFAVGLTSTLGAATPPVYDPLSAGPIDSTKWDTYEYFRVIDTDVNMLKLGVRSAAGSTGPITSSLPIKDPSTATKIQAKIVPLDFATGDVSPTAKVMTMVGGRFYNDGTTDGKTGSCLGDILAQVGVGTTDLTPTAFSIYWSVVRYTTDDCNTTTKLGSGVFLPTAVTGAASTVSVQWNEVDKFTFKYDDGAGTVLTRSFTDTTSASINPPNNPFKGLYAKIKDNVGLNGRIFAHFDDVEVNGVLYDDFSADLIDQTKWGSYEYVRTIDDTAQHLVLMARGVTESATLTDNNLAIASPESVGAVQATVTAAELDLTANGLGNPFVYVGGRFFNDGLGGPGAYEGDIAAFIKLQKTKDGVMYLGKWKVLKFTGDTLADQELIADGDSGKAILLNKPYTLSVSWDGSRFTFVGNKQTVHYTPPITVTASAIPAKMPFKGVGAAISDGGVDATAVGYFTNVIIGAAPEFITMDISGTGSVKSSPAGILCGNGGTACSKAFPLEKKVTLTAKAGTGWVFQKWEGAGAGECTTKSSCRVTVNAAKSVQADFMKFPTLLVSPKSKNYGNVQAVSKIRTAVFTIMNKTTKGVTPLNINGALSLAITQGDPGEFVIQDDLCSNTTLQPKGKCTFKVVFQPASTGAKAANVTFPCDDPSPPTLQLIGNGVQ
jgi:hypothetical protein